jgi:dTDP-4-amino-4,6-dideoxygalactose transaminase/lipopolysaccharide/colanic/teichoic acid biosynthesis glycosyltransferase
MSSDSANFLPFHLPLIEEDDVRAVCDTLRSGWITTGPKAHEFEDEFAQFIGSRHAVAVNSGTAALHVALEAIGLQEGDEVIVPTLTFAATAEAVLYFKARPILVDCDPDTFNLDPDRVEEAITRRSRAIVPVHFAGQSCEMDSLLDLARMHRLRVIEDAAHALPTSYRGRRVGAIGDITCFSFYATKTMTTGEGGMATTEDDEFADRMRMMRLHGISKDAWKRYSAEGSWRYEILAPGFKYNLTDLQAALGLTQLAKCNAMWQRRCELARRYSEGLAGIDAYQLPYVRPDSQHAWHLYAIRTRSAALSIHRDEVIEELRNRGIGVSVHFIPLHTHPYYRSNFGYRSGDFPVAEDYFDRCISLPIYPAMSNADQDRVIDSLTTIARTFRRPSRRSFAQTPEFATIEPSTLAASAPDETQRNAAYDDRSLGWYGRTGKRCFDIAAACLLLVPASPALLLCAMAVWLSSRGPIFFRQTRVGLGGRLFNIIKLRTMRQETEQVGLRITSDGDARVTTVGRWLRKLKLDELPQLINVLRGDMSLVGPRPEVPEYAAAWTSEQRRILAFRPGITGAASVAFIDEEKLLAAHPDKERFYLSVLMPQKLSMELAWSKDFSLSADLRILLATAGKLFGGESRPSTGAVSMSPAAADR